MADINITVNASDTDDTDIIDEEVTKDTKELIKQLIVYTGLPLLYFLTTLRIYRKLRSNIFL